MITISEKTERLLCLGSTSFLAFDLFKHDIFKPRCFFYDYRKTRFPVLPMKRWTPFQSISGFLSSTPLKRLRIQPVSCLKLDSSVLYVQLYLQLHHISYSEGSQILCKWLLNIQWPIKNPTTWVWPVQFKGFLVKNSWASA